MKIEKTTLPSLAEWPHFHDFFKRYAEEIAKCAQYLPVLSRPKLSDAHFAWTEDLKRVEQREGLEDGLDHFKQSGHLAFWLRRFAPVVDYRDLTTNYQDGGAHQFVQSELDMRNLLNLYGGEYMAFDIGLQFCMFYEKTRANPSPRATNMTIDMDYITAMCHFMKFKQVSPHALFLIYKSLFV